MSSFACKFQSVISSSLVGLGARERCCAVEEKKKKEKGVLLIHAHCKRERDQLGLWMLSCSNCDEQYWLNTCEVGARNIMMACRMPTIAHCIEFTREVVSHLRLNRVRNLSTVTPWTFSLWNMCCRSKSLREFCEEILLKVDLELDRLEERVRAVLKAQNKHKELQLLTQDWNKTTQFLSCIFYPEEPVVLSKKLISNHWQLSAKLIALPCILGSFLPGEPFVMKRWFPKT